MPGVVAIYLTGSPRPGVGPQDVALAIIGKVFANGYVKNKVMEFVAVSYTHLVLPKFHRNSQRKCSIMRKQEPKLCYGRILPS